MRLYRGEESTSAVCRNTDGRVALCPTKPASLRARTISLTSTLWKSWPLEELVCCWQKAGQTKLLQSSSSLTESFFWSWWSTRQFSPSFLYMHLKWTYPKPPGNISMISWNIWLPKSQPLKYWKISWWMEWWCWCFCHCHTFVYSDGHGGHSFGTCNVEGERVPGFAI